MKPGLAMTRSIGDHIARSLGVIWDPDVDIIEIKQKYWALVIGSDGIFDWVNQDEIGEILWKDRAKPPEEIANNLVQLSVERWKAKENMVDDWTWVVVQIKSL